MPARLSAYIARIAVESSVPDCWPCTLLRVSIRLQKPMVFAAVAMGLVAGLAIGVLLGRTMLR